MQIAWHEQARADGMYRLHLGIADGMSGCAGTGVPALENDRLDEAVIDEHRRVHTRATRHAVGDAETKQLWPRGLTNSACQTACYE